MAEDLKTLLSNLKKLGDVDAKLAGILAERKQFEEERAQKENELKKLELESVQKTQAFKERQVYYQREERHLKEAQQKLIDRRKALSSLGDYKTQLAAEREIDAVSKQLSAQEEALLKVLENVEELEKAAKGAQERVDGVKAQIAKLDADAKETLTALEEREARHTEERTKLAEVIDAPSMSLYQRVRSRFPLDPVVPIRGTSCSGCFFAVGPQQKVQIARGNAIVRCPSCKRILYLDEGQEE